MIDQSRTKWYIAKDMPVASGVTSLTEGSALVQTIENGEAKVKNSTGGSNNEIFVGVAYSQMDAATVGADVRTFTIPASPYQITLPNMPNGGYAAVLVKEVGGSVYTGATTSPSGTGNFQLPNSSNVITFHSADVGKTVTITYKFNLSVLQARMLTGDGILGLGNPVQASGSCGVIQNGLVFTDQFDPAADWGAANVADIKAGANGQFQRAGTGATVSGYVISVPSMDRPFLGLQIRA